MSAREVVKAHLSCMENGSLSMDVQFNPTSFKFTRKVGWKEEAAAGKGWSNLQFSGGNRDGLQVSLLLDETESERSVLPAVLRFYRMTVPLEAGEEAGGARPPRLVFAWEQFQFQGVLQNVDVEMLFFDTSGRPKRAKVDLSFLGNAFSPSTSADDFFSARSLAPTSGAGSSSSTASALGDPRASMLDF